MKLALPARAKLNLDLQVLGRRPDGYHEVKTTLQAISLHDLLLAEPAAETELQVRGEFHVDAATPNLVLAALQLLEEAASRRLPTRLVLVKRVPVGSGLGGASSDAAAALRILSRLHRLEVDLEPLGRALGADVGFFLRGGTAKATGRGDELEPLQFRPRWFGLAWPRFPLSTAAVYERWEPGEASPGNDLLEAAIRLEPPLRNFAEHLGEGWQMTGTGSAFFRPFPDATAAAAATQGLDAWTAVARALPAWG